MKWLDIEKIKAQLRLDDLQVQEEQELLKLYGNSAEESILRILNRSYADLVGEYGEVPQDIIHASLLLVDLSYQQRSPVSTQSMPAVGYTLDMKLKPYMRLTGGDAEPVQEVTLGSDMKIVFTADLPDGLMLKDIDFNGTIYNTNDPTIEVAFGKAGCIMVGEGREYAVLVNSEDLGIGTIDMVLNVFIPDTDYKSGTRKEVLRINPHINIKG